MPSARGVCFLLVMFLSSSRVIAAPFVNLGFEDAQIVYLDPESEDAIDTALAFPGWSITTNWLTPYRTFCLASGCVSLHDTQTSSLEGEYFAYIQTRYTGFGAIEQTGDIPGDAQSIRFWTVHEFNYNLRVWVNDEPVPLRTVESVPIGGTIPGLFGGGGHRDTLAGDISRFAGQTVTLRISGALEPESAMYTGSGVVDNIVFSPLPVPEPASLTLAVMALGGLCALVGRRSARRRV